MEAHSTGRTFVCGPAASGLGSAAIHRGVQARTHTARPAGRSCASYSLWVFLIFHRMRKARLNSSVPRPSQRAAPAPAAQNGHWTNPLERRPAEAVAANPPPPPSTQPPPPPPTHHAPPPPPTYQAPPPPTDQHPTLLPVLSIPSISKLPLVSVPGRLLILSSAHTSRPARQTASCRLYPYLVLSPSATPKNQRRPTSRRQAQQEPSEGERVVQRLCRRPVP